jgi:hypothetical protein
VVTLKEPVVSLLPYFGPKSYFIQMKLHQHFCLVYNAQGFPKYFGHLLSLLLAEIFSACLVVMCID